MNMEEKLTHDDLVEIGYKWVMSRCSFAFKELKFISLQSELPDVIGFNTNGSFLLEAKTSLSDFYADQKKMFRTIYPHYGMGDWRFYIAPKGLIEIEMLPDKWGLIEVNEKRKAKIVHNPMGKGNVYSSWCRHPKNEASERMMLLSALRRMEIAKVLQDNLK